MRIIYYWWSDEGLFYLFSLYDKDEMDDLTKKQKDILARMLEQIKRGNKL